MKEPTEEEIWNAHFRIMYDNVDYNFVEPQREQGDEIPSGALSILYVQLDVAGSEGGQDQPYLVKTMLAHAKGNVQLQPGRQQDYLEGLQALLENCHAVQGSIEEELPPQVLKRQRGELEILYLRIPPLPDQEYDLSKGSMAMPW